MDKTSQFMIVSKKLHKCDNDNIKWSNIYIYKSNYTIQSISAVESKQLNLIFRKDDEPSHHIKS